MTRAHAVFACPILLGLLMWGCGEAPPPEGERSPPVGERSPTEPENAVLLPLGSAPFDTLSLNRPASIQPAVGGFVVADPFGGRVLLLDWNGGVRTFGREGSGPGELGDPRFAVADSTRVLAADLQNRRVTTFAIRTGEVLTEIEYPPPSLFASFVPDSGDAILAPAGGLSTPVVRWSSLGGRPFGPERDTVASRPSLSFDLLARGPDGPVRIAPPDRIEWLDWSGNVLATERLPAEVKEAAGSAVEAARGRHPGPDQPLLKSASIDEAGDLVCLVVGKPTDVVGFTRTAEGHVTILRVGAMAPDALAMLHSAAGAVARGDTLFVAHRGGIARFEIQRR